MKKERRKRRKRKKMKVAERLGKRRDDGIGKERKWKIRERKREGGG